MSAPVILWAIFVYYLITLIIAESLIIDPNWTSRRLLNSTIEEEKSVFEKIKEFYDDPNNLAMYGVLPLIVLVYGGFCVIYCVCKGYDDCKKRKNKKNAKKKRLLEDDDDEVVTAHSSTEQNNNNNAKNDNDMRHHPDPRAATRAAVAATSMKQQQQQKANKQHTSTSDVQLAVEKDGGTPLPWAIPDEEKLYPTKEKGHPAPPPPACETKPTIKPYKPPNRKPHPDMHMPPSPPPPYDDYGDSVEEISMNPRKVNVVSNKSNDPRKAMNAMEQYHLARQAAQLLRVDNGHPGQPGYKKPKRLVFVAE